MKKITSFLMMFLLSSGIGWAQLTPPVKSSVTVEKKQRHPYAERHHSPTRPAAASSEVTGLEEEKQKMRDWLSTVPHTVGYPTAQPRDIFREAIERATTAEALSEAKTAFMSERDSIYYPQPGKSYYLVTAPREGKEPKYYMTKLYKPYFPYQIFPMAKKPSHEDGAFTCSVEEGHYIIRNSDGNYLSWPYVSQVDSIYISSATKDCWWSIESGQNYCNGEQYRSPESKFGTVALFNIVHEALLVLSTQDGSFNWAYLPGDQVDGIIKDFCALWNFEEIPLDEFRQEAYDWLNSVPQQAGYPSQQARDAYVADIQAASSEAELQSAKERFMLSDDINMPVPGKAYAFINVTSTQQKSVLTWNQSESKVEARTYNNGDIRLEDLFVCNSLSDSKYFFVNNAGKYLTWQGDNPQQNPGDGPGYYDFYNEKADWNLFPFVEKKKDASKLGTFLLEGLRKGLSESHCYLTQDYSSHHFHAGEQGQIYDDGDKSSFWYLQEVDYPDHPQMNLIGDSKMIHIAGAKTIATFSAPFPTIIPEGVRAYYVSSVQNQDFSAHPDLYTIKLKRYTENTKLLPRNFGVILTGTEQAADSVVMLPGSMEPLDVKAGKPLEQVLTNCLGNTAGAAKDSIPNYTIFILAGGDKGVGFYLKSSGQEGETSTLAMNKAYLDNFDDKQESSVSGIRLIVDDEVTGIEEVEAPACPANAASPIYDLSGRRVMNVVKGGIYLQQGRKFIVR